MSDGLSSIVLNSFEVNQVATTLSLEAEKYAESFGTPIEDRGTKRLYFEDSSCFKKRIIDEIESLMPHIGNKNIKLKLSKLIELAESEELDNGYLISQISEDKIVLLKNCNLKPGNVYEVKYDLGEGSILNAKFVSKINLDSKDDKTLIDKNFSMKVGDDKYIHFNKKGKYDDLISRIDDVRVAVLSKDYGNKKGIYGVKITQREIKGENILYHCTPFKPLDFTPIN